MSHDNFFDPSYNLRTFVVPCMHDVTQVVWSINLCWCGNIFASCLLWSLAVIACQCLYIIAVQCSIVTPIIRQYSTVCENFSKIYWASCLQRRERTVPGAGPGPLGRPRLRERAQVRRRHRHGEWVALIVKLAMFDSVEWIGWIWWKVQYSKNDFLVFFSLEMTSLG